jgi:amino acid transporter/mannitol/fructose-specific phosphotransferase system IIA component (Ntr-type)
VALKRELGLPGVFTMAAGAMISSGLFVLPTLAYAVVGPALFLSYLLAAVLLLPSLLCKAELMTAMPKAGGTYYHVDRSLGPTMGMIGGVANWASLAFKGAFALIGIGALAAYVLPAGAGLTKWEIKAVAVAACLVFTIINLLGTRHAGRLQNLLVAGLLLGTVGYVALGVGSVDAARFAVLTPHGWNKVLVGTAMVFISFGGVTQIANLAEEVRRPKRDLVWGMFIAYGVVAAIYVAVLFVTVGVLPGDPAEWELAPLSQAAGRFAAGAGAAVMGVAAMAAYMTTGNAGILTASRTLMAMGQDELVPPALARVGGRGIPAQAVLFTSAFMAVAILALPLELFVKAASAMLILLMMLEVLAVIVMRESRVPTYRPTWRAPLYPWLPAGGLVVYAFLLVELGSLPLAIAGSVLGLGAVWFVGYARVRVMRESALVLLAERLARADFGQHDLQAELSAIVRERDEVLRDRFDHLIEECPVVDLPAGANRGELFRVLAQNMAPAVGQPAEVVYRLLDERERLSSTVVRPGVAVPHLISEQVEGLQVVLARVREGVEFGEDEAPVRAVFAIAASPQEEEFYLRALVAIAEVTQSPGFDAEWMAARSAEGLREVVLAAERERGHAPQA